jgi:hypothetical protein
MSNVREALGLARERGFAVFPVWGCENGRCDCGKADCRKPGKHPCTKFGFKEATTDSTTIERWWKERPTANIGIATGARSGVWVLDVDLHDADGEETLRQLQEIHGRVPGTLAANTGGGGRHLFFRYDPSAPVGCNTGKDKNRPGIDVRGDGGYVIAPPSVHASGKQYEWVHRQLAAEPAPVWLREVAVNGVQNKKAAGEHTRQNEKPRSIFEEINTRALLRVKDWAPQLIPGGRFSPNGAYRVSPADAGHPETEEELSVHSEGIRDFGPEPHVTYTPIDLVLKFGTPTTPRTAAAWLASRLNIEIPDGFAAAPTTYERLWPPPPQEAAFYGLAGDIVRAIGPHTEADPVAILAQVMTVFGNIVGRRNYFYVDGARHHPNLFVVVVGDTSKARKGTSWNRVRETFANAGLEDSWMRERIQNGLSTGEGLIKFVRDAVFEEEADGNGGFRTVECDPGVYDKRLLVFEAEYARVLGVMGRKDSILSTILRLAWDGDDLGIMTKNSSLRATDPHISVIGQITCEDLRDNLKGTDAANGFANRNIYLCVRRSKLLPHGGDTEALNAVLQPLQSRLKKIISVACDTENVSLDPKEAERRIIFDPQAHERWSEIYADLAEGMPGLLGWVTARGEAQVVRLALTYALLDASDVIRLPHLEAGVALWRYAEASAAYIFGDNLGDADADKILALLKKAGKNGSTRTEIGDEMAGHHITRARMKRALELLSRYGRAVMEQRRTRGRSEEVWRAT